MVAAGRFQLADFVAERLVVAAQEFADGHDDVYLRGAVLDGQGRFGHFDFNQACEEGKLPDTQATSTPSTSSDWLTICAKQG